MIHVSRHMRVWQRMNVRRVSGVPVAGYVSRAPHPLPAGRVPVGGGSVHALAEHEGADGHLLVWSVCDLLGVRARAGRGALRVRVRRPAPGDPYSLVEALGPCAPPMIGRRVVPLRNGRRTDRVFGLCVSALLVTRYCLRTTSCHVCVYQCACIIVSLDVRRLTNFQSCFPSGIGVSVRFVRVRFA